MIVYIVIAVLVIAIGCHQIVSLQARILKESRNWCDNALHLIESMERSIRVKYNHEGWVSQRDLILRFVGDIRTQLPRCARLPCDQKSIMAALDVLEVQIAERDAHYGISG